MLLFGLPDHKDEAASSAYDAEGIVQLALRALRSQVPGLVLITDVCLCQYTSHGHCGVLRDGRVDNDITLELLSQTAVSHARAGADIVTSLIRRRAGGGRASTQYACASRPLHVPNWRPRTPPERTATMRSERARAPVRRRLRARIDLANQ